MSSLHRASTDALMNPNIDIISYFSSVISTKGVCELNNVGA